METNRFEYADISDMTVAELEQLILGSAYRSRTAELAWVNPDEFATQFIALYNTLTEPIQKQRCQIAIYNAIRALPLQDEQYDVARAREVFIIGRHLSSPMLSLYLYREVRKMRGRAIYGMFWRSLGDIVVSTISRPLEHEDVFFNCKALVCDRRFLEFRGMLFFRIAEVRPRQCVDLFPFLMEYLRAISDTPEHVRRAQKRFFMCFTPLDIAFVTEQLSQESIDLAAEVFAFFIVRNRLAPITLVDYDHGNLALAWRNREGVQKKHGLKRCEGALRAQRRAAAGASVEQRLEAIWAV